MDEKMEQLVDKASNKGGISPKIFLFGLPLFIIQLVIVYFITANILMNKVGNGGGNTMPHSNNTEYSEDADSTQIGVNIFTINDIIINPAGTKGQRLLLVSIAFDLSREEYVQRLRDKEVIVKDMIINILSSKTLSDLSDVENKNTVKEELSKNIIKIIPNVQINSIYFSKYVIT